MTTEKAKAQHTPGIVAYPLFAVCEYCGQRLQFDIDTDGTPGSNADWGADGDYGCGDNPRNDDEGTFGHLPGNITWEGHSHD